MIKCYQWTKKSIQQIGFIYRMLRYQRGLSLGTQFLPVQPKWMAQIKSPLLSPSIWQFSYPCDARPTTFHSLPNSNISQHWSSPVFFKSSRAPSPHPPPHPAPTAQRCTYANRSDLNASTASMTQPSSSTTAMAALPSPNATTAGLTSYLATLLSLVGTGKPRNPKLVVRGCAGVGEDTVVVLVNWPTKVRYRRLQKCPSSLQKTIHH